jgi:hypothetical protein
MHRQLCSRLAPTLALMASPALGAAPANHPEPAVLASRQSSPHDLAIDRTSVYFTDNDGVTKVPIAGGAPVVLARSEHFPSSLVVDKANVYFGSAGSTTMSGATGKATANPPAIRKVPLAGGAASTFVPLQQIPSSLTVDAANLYWVDCTGAVGKIPLAGGAVTPLAPSSAKSCGMANSKPLIAVDATSVYFTTQGALMKVPLTGGKPVQLVAAPHNGFVAARTGIAVDATNVYLTTANVMTDGVELGTVQKVPISGGAVTTLWSGPKNPIAVAVDDSAVYWLRGTAPGDNGNQWDDVSVVVRLPKSGGPPARLVRGHAVCAAGTLALDDASVYFTHAVCGPGGTIMSQKGTIERAPKQCPAAGCGPDVDGPIQERKTSNYVDEAEGGACDAGMDMACESECEQGSMLGCYKLGVMYRDGIAVTRDPERAAALFRKACKGGSAQACASAHGH